MIPRDTFAELYDYNWWARDRQLEACAALTPERFLRPVGGSFLTVRDTLAHLLGVEWLYLERWSGRSPRALPSSEEFPTLEPLRVRWDEVERDSRAVLAGLTDARLAESITYTNMKGESKTFPLWKIFYHLLNHQSYHRGQVTTQLRQLGAAPVPVDYGRWLDAHKEEKLDAPAIPLAAWKELFAYNHWARDRQLAAAAGLSQENLLRPLGSSFSSLRDTLVHLAASEWVWLSAWRDHSPTPQEREQFAPEKFADVAAIRDRWAEVEGDLRDYVADLQADAPARPFTYTNRKGQAVTFTLWRLFYHLLNHQSYHRGQVTTQLRQLGAAPPQVDYYFWLSERSVDPEQARVAGAPKGAPRRISREWSGKRSSAGCPRARTDAFRGLPAACKGGDHDSSAGPAPTLRLQLLGPRPAAPRLRRPHRGKVPPPHGQ